MYSIDYDHLSNSVMPPKRRTTLFINFLKACLRPLKTLNAQMVDHRNTIAYKLQFNAQVQYLEHYLNDLYDHEERRIHITDGSNLEIVHLHNDVEAIPPVYLFNESEDETPLYFNNLSEFASDIDYIVNVPDDLVFEELEMRSKINQYNLAGRRYQITTYEEI